ncbi:hypothetical protein KP509_12G047400 [Ceratopteris richardii]|uniref:Uncharacterized protein n=1 Tax=Ceratopteris richardii TaxID=49495 RepID=A0A8T2TLI2_CERRI|nr:hypothetical protein KP509_12G047400 [Ceratopteris richardii]
MVACDHAAGVWLIPLLESRFSIAEGFDNWYTAYSFFCLCLCACLFGIFCLIKFVYVQVWRAAISEFIVTALLVFVNTAGAITCLQAGFTSSTAAISVITFFCLAFFILGAAPASGGHLNPAITFATVLTGFCSPARGLLYVIGQIAGSVIGALALKVVVAESVAEKYGLGGCYLKNTIYSDGVLQEVGIEPGPALLAEFVFTLVVLFFAFSIALDPKQFQVSLHV